MQVAQSSNPLRDAAAISKSKATILKLREVLGGALSELPENYAEQFDYEFSDGDISLLRHLSKVDNIDELDQKEFAELVDKMVKVDPSEWPSPDAIEEIIYARLFEAPEEEFAEQMEGINFAEEDDANFGTKVEKMLRAVISTVYRDGVDRVVGKDGKAPNEGNNFLLSEDGKTFEGVFITSPSEGKRDKFKFTITEKSTGGWKIVY
jgi:hypothetical protein